MKNLKALKIILIVSLLLNLLMGAYVCKRAYFILYGKDLKFLPEKCDDHCKYFKRVLKFEMEKNEPGEIVFLGNSLTEYNDWAVMFQDSAIKNRGIGGDNTVGILKRLDEVLEAHPKKIFLEIGINDILGWSAGYQLPENYTNEMILKNYEKIILRIKTESPETKLFIQNVLPVQEENQETEERINNRIRNFNQSLKIMSKLNQVIYIDLYQHFEEKGSLKEEFTYDGLHLTEKGYLLWKKVIHEKVKE